MTVADRTTVMDTFNSSGFTLNGLPCQCAGRKNAFATLWSNGAAVEYSWETVSRLVASDVRDIRAY